MALFVSKNLDQYGCPESAEIMEISCHLRKPITECRVLVRLLIKTCRTHLILSSIIIEPLPKKTSNDGFGPGFGPGLKP